MDTQTPVSAFYQRHRLFFKGMIMGFLIIIMIIPTVLVNNLVSERKLRQSEIVREVASKWSGEQIVSGPFLYVPYIKVISLPGTKTEETINHFWILPEVLNTNGIIDHQLRKRSIYNVLLYRANLRHTGNFIISIPKDIDSASILWKDAQLCYGISDFRGIEEKIVIKFRNKDHELAPGLPDPALPRYIAMA